MSVYILWNHLGIIRVCHRWPHRVRTYEGITPVWWWRMCFQNIINWRRLTYISVSRSIRSSLQIDLIVLQGLSWSFDRDKFQAILHSWPYEPQTSFSTLPCPVKCALASKQRLILLFRVRWKQLYQFCEASHHHGHIEHH